MSTKNGEKIQIQEHLQQQQKQQLKEEMKENPNPEIQKQETKQNSYLYQAASIFKAYKNIRQIVRRTIIQRSSRLSDLYQANIFFKREDGQITRTYKVRGAVNKILSLTPEEKQKGVYCCSAGNQGVAVAFACNHLKVKGIIFVPQTTPNDKIQRIKEFGKEFIEVKLAGLSLQDCDQIATKYGEDNKLISVRLDEKDVIEGCSGVGIEILEDFPLKGKIDYVIFPISSGTLGAGISSYFHQLSPETNIIGIKPIFSENEMVYEDMQKTMQLDAKNTFKVMDDLSNYQELEIPEGEAYDQVLQLYNNDGIILEPHGALAPASLKLLQEKCGSLKGKNIVCILTGKNTSISRMNDIKILANVYQKKNVYMLVDFFRKPDAIKEFMVYCLSPEDEILQIEYTKKNNREKGPALVGIELASPGNYDKLLAKMLEMKISHKIIQPNDEIFQLKV
ncbi:pyridoxal-phosphate-dependent enzyme family protein (macronuclear) [Tetrahymena thermophila SB210]|uniref:threonine ammonia-lyase n=1 Tax=Tetrahymena thermophila (strain SB210) TaxID=312017 RepID=Q23WP3_TETTS|nr:pyridoxal-phosphate-dependent enzyme family protein [Tetrahymena thermophila SB210]EAS00937.2 pyridoxal-phosphate-dependent enzyme family protein [Tetrahymena thermophila SB210]|eukprot:XP_001021182.2 pyridoxal-phosphate-dependent enzyme family protein [Tetrahymena thermophila SB210]